MGLMRDIKENPSLSTSTITMAPASSHTRQNGSLCNGEPIIQNGSHDNKSAIMGNGTPQRHRRFGQVTPLMVCHMKDHKIVDFPMSHDSHSAIINEPPFSSSTLLKDSSKKLSRVTDKQNTVADNDDFEQDSLEHIADHIEHMHVSPKQEPICTNKEHVKTLINNRSTSSTDEGRNSRKLPTTPTEKQLTIVKKERVKTTKKRRTFSLPSSPFNLRKTSRHSFKRQANSLRDRLRQSFHHRQPIYDPEQDLFPEDREYRYYQGAKRRGRRGAVISLEVNQTVSLVRPQASNDHFLEFSFVPPNKSEVTS
uniref:Uncharacterized protein n=1 Tax=Clytia hemisphaerica TaxID=252671 RepID=A0A7M6DIX3_9CNID